MTVRRLGAGAEGECGERRGARQCEIAKLHGGISLWRRARYRAGPDFRIARRRGNRRIGIDFDEDHITPAVVCPHHIAAMEPIGVANEARVVAPAQVEEDAVAIDIAAMAVVGMPIAVVVAMQLP